MIPAALAAQLQAYIRPTDTPLVQVVDAIQGIRQLFTVGEQVRAQVTSLLPGGRFAVMVKDQLLDLNLPRNTQAGEEIDMQVLANSPRLAFLLSRQNAQADLAPPPLAANTSAPVDLSETARFLGDLLAEASGQQDEPAQAATLARSNPLIDGARVDTLKLAEVLKQALTEGGLFYESHLAEWTLGERSLSQLLREPPNAWQVGGKLEAANAESPPARPPLEAKAGNALPPHQQMEVEASRQATESLAAELDKHSLDTMPTAARQLVQQQLQLLDQRQLAWQGLAWPGQGMRWEVEEDRGERHAEELDTSSVWRTRLQLELPHLGHVEATISLHERKRVEVGFRVVDPNTATRIRDAQTQLQSRLDAAGLELTANQISLVKDNG